MVSSPFPRYQALHVFNAICGICLKHKVQLVLNKISSPFGWLLFPWRGQRFFGWWLSVLDPIPFQKSTISKFLEASLRHSVNIYCSKCHKKAMCRTYHFYASYIKNFFAQLCLIHWSRNKIDLAFKDTQIFNGASLGVLSSSIVISFRDQLWEERNYVLEIAILRINSWLHFPEIVSAPKSDLFLLKWRLPFKPDLWSTFVIDGRCLARGCLTRLFKYLFSFFTQFHVILWQIDISKPSFTFRLHFNLYWSYAQWEYCIYQEINLF